MAQSTTTDAGTVIIPGAYPEYQVVSSPSSLATSGVLVFMGEANQGPDFTAESDLGLNGFGPDSESEVVAKYGSGNLVNAYRGAVAAANDPDIKGTFTSAIFVKTNISGKASGTLKKWNASTYGTVQDKSFGLPGNLISTQVTAKTSESVPSTGPFALLVPTVSTEIDFRVNGGAKQTIAPGTVTPDVIVGDINGLTGVKATGGVNRGVLGSVSGTVALAIVSGNKVTVTYSGSLAGTVSQPGDTLYIPASSVLAASNAAAAGSYVVDFGNTNSITATKLRDVTGAHNALTPPTAKTATNVAATGDVQVFSAVTIQLLDFANDSVTPIDGVGKALEISCPNAASLADIAANPDGSPCTFFSTPSIVKVLVSSAEYVADLTDARQSSGVSEDVVAGGKVAFAIGYEGTTANLVNDGTTMTITVTGGSGASPAPISLKHYNTISDLAAYISSLTGFTAAPGTATLGSSSPLTLDTGTFTFATTFGGTAGRIKQDAYAFFTAVNANSVLVQLAAQAAAGLPAPSAIAFLTGGTLGGTTDAAIQAATVALKLVRANFVIPLFSRDATADIADGLTDTSSTYTIAGIHSYVRAHVLSVSTMKAKRHRQAFLSIRDTFANCQTTSANLASSRVSCAFEDVMDADGSVGVEQYQPWMAAVKAAGMQAGAFYQAIFNRGISISGAVQAAGDWKDQDDDQVEEALQAGLLPIQRDETGLFYFTSDQTTYTTDDNFVFNSIQAMYAADLVTLTTAQRMQKAFVGKSLADVSASLASTTISSIMADLMRLKLISPSDDAPKGYKNVSIKIKGPVMAVKLAVKLSTSIYFVIINFTVEQVQQSA